MTRLSGWGRYPGADVALLRPGAPGDVKAALHDVDGVIARGNGRAYGDAAIGTRACLSILALDRVLAFDPGSGRVTVEAGMQVNDLIATFLPRGFFPPVVPGTCFPTVGGLIAADAHGKNHHRDGGFGDQVEALTLQLASGETCILTPENALFAATVGGMGLTGVVLDATFTLRRVESGLIRQQTIVAGNLRAAMAALDEGDAAQYSVAWIDASATGATLGRSLVFLGQHATAADVGAERAHASLAARPPARLAVPFDLPAFTLNRASVAAFNTLYFRKGAMRAGASFLVPHAPYFFPLDAISGWNRIYGARGFLQHQCVLPLATAEAALAEIMQRVAARGTASPLAVLKKLGAGHGLLSFPLPGFTLALDFAVSDDIFGFLDDLDAIVLRAGGRLYLAKDARQSRPMFEAGYPRLAEFRKIRQQVDPAGKFASQLSRRLGL